MAERVYEVEIPLSTLRHQMGDDPPVIFMLEKDTRDPLVVAYFTVEGEPESKNRARWSSRSGGRPYTPERTRQAEAKIGWLFRQSSGPYQPTADSNFGVFAGFFCETRQRRDVDNMLKLVLDGLNKVAWDDDSQVTEVSGKVHRALPNGSARTEVLIYRTFDQPAPTRTCAQCGEAFKYYPSMDGRRFCNRACGYAWRREQNKRTCLKCSKEFQKVGPAKYCSKTCAYSDKHADLTCVQCGQPYSQAQSTAATHVPACSTECRIAYWRDRRSQAAKGTCEDCGGATSKKSYRRCQACDIERRARPHRDAVESTDAEGGAA